MTTEERREYRRMKKYLTELTTEVRVIVEELDALMKQPSTFERGQKIGRVVTRLEFANDSARHFGLWQKL